MPTLDRVISVRSTFGMSLQKYGTKVTSESNRRHYHFVRVLKQVREILQPLVPSKTGAQPPQASRTATTPDIENRFSALNIYYPSKAFLDATSDQEPPRPSNRDAESGITYQAQVEASWEEAHFVFSILKHELHRLRLRIKWIWGAYRDTQIELVSAALATNTAIDLARDLIEEAMPMLESHKLWTLANEHYLACCVAEGFDPASLSNHVPGQDYFNYDYYYLAEATLFSAHRVIMSFASVLQPERLPIYQDGTFGIYDPTADRETMSGSEKCNEDQALLMEFFTELVAVNRGVQNYPVKDEFTRGMKDFEKQQTDPPFYLVFAAQVFLDIHHILRARAVEPFKQVLKEAISARLELTRHLEFHKDLKISHWPARNDAILTDMKKKLEWICQDPVYEVKAATYKKRGAPIPKDLDRHRILKRSPVISGLLLFHIRAEMHEIGIAVANAWGSILFAGHLYRALRNEKLLVAHWLDMDIAAGGVLGTSDFFVGGPPATLAESFSRFCMQMGVSAAALAEAKKAKKQPFTRNLASKAGPRGFGGTVPVSDMFVGRYARGEARVNWTAEYVENVISRSEFEVDEDEEDGGVLVVAKADEEKVREKRREHEKKKKKKKANTRRTDDGPKLKPKDLIEKLVIALHSEAIQLAFPYLQFHRICWEMLREVKNACHKRLLEMHGPEYMEEESQLPWVVGYILIEAAPVGGYQDLRLLALAAEAVNGVLSKGEGGAVVRALDKDKGFSLEIEE